MSVYATSRCPPTMSVFLKVNWDNVRLARGLGVNEFDAIGPAEAGGLPSSPAEDTRRPAFERAPCGRGGPSVVISNPSLVCSFGTTVFVFWPWSGLGMTRTLGRISSTVEYSLGRRSAGAPLMNEAASGSRSMEAFESVLVCAKVVGSRREDREDGRNGPSPARTFREPMEPMVATDIDRARAFGSNRDA